MPTELWAPSPRPRSTNIEMDMKVSARPNPYYVTEEDVKLRCRVFGTKLHEDDVGLRCQLVWNNARDTIVFQVENRHQMLERLSDAKLPSVSVLKPAAPRERLADLEHEQWGHWTHYMLGVLKPLMRHGRVAHANMISMGPVPEPLQAAVDALRRWEKQIATPFSELSEKEKDSDREWADKVLHSMSGYAVVFKDSEAHHSLAEAGWAEADEQPIDNLRIMEW